MLGTDFSTMGGISSVVGVYRNSGMLRRQQVRYIATHCDGSNITRLAIMCRAWLTFMGLLLRGQVELLHVHLASRASFWRKLMFIAPANWARVPTLIHLHGAEFDDFYERECGTLAKAMVRWVFDRSSRVVVLSTVWAQWVRGVTEKAEVRVIHNPVIIANSPVDWDLRTPGLGLFLGRMGKRKGTFDLLECLARARASGSRAELALAGDGDAGEVRAMIAHLSLDDSVQVLGWVRGDVKQYELNRASFYVLPSYKEGLPMSLIEAMAAGLPVISTTVGGIPELVTHGVEGFLVEPGDLVDLSGRLVELSGNSELAQRMGAAARQKVEGQFDSRVVLPQMESLYAELRRNVT